MKCPALAFLMAVGACFGQLPPYAHYVEIKLPPDVKSENFFARFIFEGQDFGDWIQPRPGVSAYDISTMSEGRQARRLKAIFYAPGCAIRILDIPLSDSENPSYSFACEPVGNITITGSLMRIDRLYGLDVRLEAKYAAHWAREFLGLDRGVLTAIPVGDVANLSEDGRFRLKVPDLSRDPLAGALEYPGELQIWAKDKRTGAIVAKLIPVDPQPAKTQSGGLKVRGEYTEEIVFSPCAMGPPRHDSWGFAVRPPSGDACDR